ncbi:hypothetical protein XCR_0612 [Xanthomonas campestris pv. raphani 756C]|nr:hypothetical protein XCR_0612 [Xanthomonas campestris pv. raphani 756C]
MVPAARSGNAEEVTHHDPVVSTVWIAPLEETQQQVCAARVRP